jgi:hypothetical protein
MVTSSFPKRQGKSKKGPVLLCPVPVLLGLIPLGSDLQSQTVAKCQHDLHVFPNLECLILHCYPRVSYGYLQAFLNSKCLRVSYKSYCCFQGPGSQNSYKVAI